MTSKRGKRQGLRARSKNARQKKKTVKSVDWLTKRGALLKRTKALRAAKKSTVKRRTKKPGRSVRENPKAGVRASASSPPSIPQSGSADAEGGTPASTEAEAEFQQAGETPADPFEDTLPVPGSPAPEPYDLPDGTPNPNAPDTVYS
jgi:hypothetical protein